MEVHLAGIHKVLWRMFLKSGNLNLVVDEVLLSQLVRQHLFTLFLVSLDHLLLTLDLLTVLLHEIKRYFHLFLPDQLLVKSARGIIRWCLS